MIRLIEGLRFTYGKHDVDFNLILCEIVDCSVIEKM